MSQGRSRFQMILLLGLALACALICYDLYAESPANPTSASTPVPQAQIPATQTHAPEASYTPAIPSTSTVQPVRTPLPASPTRAPTLAPLPTMPEAEKETLVLDLLQKNGGCELPCWWGFTPGVTAWKTVGQFFLSHGERGDRPDRYSGWYSGGFTLEQFAFDIAVHYFTGNEMVKVFFVTSWTSPRPDKLIYGDPFYKKAMQRYAASQIISSLGRPEQARILVDGVQDTEMPDYHLLLYYPGNGVLVEYEGHTGTIDGRLRICPLEAMISMWLWPPGAGLSLEDAFSTSPYIPQAGALRYLSRFRPIEMASGMNLEQFAQTLKMKGACLDRPASLWGRK